MLFLSFVAYSHALRAEDLSVVYEGGDGPGRGKHVVLVAGDEEYRSEESLSQLGKILAKRHGFKCTLLLPIRTGSSLVDPTFPSNIPGLEALRSADLMVIQVRFRNLPDSQMAEIDRYLKTGKPVLGIRTSTHAFRIAPERKEWLHYDYRYNGPTNWVHFDPKYRGPLKEWDRGFGGVVMGDTWFYHYGYHNHQSTRGLIAAKEHPITRGLKDGDIWGPTDVYAVRLPLPAGSIPIVLGQTINRKEAFDANDPFLGMRPTDDVVAGVGNNPTADRGDDRYNPNDPMMPIAWTKTYQVPGGASAGRVFATTIGASVDLASAGVRRLMVNGVYWCVGLEEKIPANGTDVERVGEFKPSAFHFHDGNYWQKKNLRPEALK